MIPAKVEKRRFPAHKIQEVLKELEKPRDMAELTQSSLNKKVRRSVPSRKTISAPSFIKYQKNQKKGFFDWLKGKQNKPPSQVIDNNLNKRIEMVKQQESNKRHREQYKDLYKKGFNRKEVELLLQADINKGKKGRSLSLSKKPKERKLSNPDLKFGKPQKRGFFDFFKRKQAAPVIDNNLNKRIEMVKQQESNKRHREQYKELYNKGLNRKEIELLNKDLNNKKSKKAKSTSFSFGNKEKNKYQGHMSAPETISLNKGQLRVSVPSLDKKAKEYFDKKLMKKIEEIKSKVPPKKQKGWFQTLFNNESSSKSGEKKQKKKWYEY